jgi:hypothetical protein
MCMNLTWNLTIKLICFNILQRNWPITDLETFQQMQNVRVPLPHHSHGVVHTISSNCRSLLSIQWLSLTNFLEPAIIGFRWVNIRNWDSNYRSLDCRSSALEESRRNLVRIHQTYMAVGVAMITTAKTPSHQLMKHDSGRQIKMSFP